MDLLLVMHVIGAVKRMRALFVFGLFENACVGAALEGGHMRHLCIG